MTHPLCLRSHLKTKLLLLESLTALTVILIKVHFGLVTFLQCCSPHIQKQYPLIWNPRVTNGVSSGLSRDNIANNTPSSLDDTAMTSSEKDVMKEFEDTVNDIMIQGRLYHLPENISLCFKSSLGRPACGSTICNLFF